MRRNPCPFSSHVPPILIWYHEQLFQILCKLTNNRNRHSYAELLCKTTKSAGCYYQKQWQQCQVNEYQQQSNTHFFEPRKYKQVNRHKVSSSKTASLVLHAEMQKSSEMQNPLELITSLFCQNQVRHQSSVFEESRSLSELSSHLYFNSSHKFFILCSEDVEVIG